MLQNTSERETYYPESQRANDALGSAFNTEGTSNDDNTSSSFTSFKNDEYVAPKGATPACVEIQKWWRVRFAEKNKKAVEEIDKEYFKKYPEKKNEKFQIPKTHCQLMEDKNYLYKSLYQPDKLDFYFK